MDVIKMLSFSIGCIILMLLLSEAHTDQRHITHQHQLLSNTLETLVAKLVAFNDESTSGQYKRNTSTPSGGRYKRDTSTPSSGNEADQSWMDNVGGYLDTVGEWLSTANGMADNVMGIVNIATNIVGILDKRDQAKEAERRHAMEMAFKTEELCDKICVTEWSAWTPCTARCGGGLTFRQRQKILPGRCRSLNGFVCRHSVNQTGYCNPQCPNGGWPAAGGGACTCRRGFNGQCCNNDIVCNYPGKPRHGDLEGTFPAQYGSVVSYNCNDGFAMIGEGELVCHEDGVWTNQKPQCKRVTCTTPTSPENGRLLNQQATYVYGEEAVYMCDDGYLLRGPEKRKCDNSLGSEHGRWTGFTPFCQPVACKHPLTPLYGEMHGSRFRLGDSISYSCMPGFRLVGSAERRCMSSSTWSGHEPTCEVMQCEVPFAPKNGLLVNERKEYRLGQFATFECNIGYHLEGESVIKCVADVDSGPLGTGGIWNSLTPTCKASTCEDPGNSEHGFKDGSIYYYPHNVTYTCFAGYIQHGVSKIHCQADGSWSNVPPTCTACPLNTYLPSSEDGATCLPCPVHTHTVTEGSTSVKQCICDYGFISDDEGQCKEISCSYPDVPDHGTIEDCGDKLGNNCEFDCVEGYIMERGSSRRTCQESGEWSGVAPVCVPCPKNTYKSDARSCLPCPKHSHTEGEASSLDQCICDKGYEGPAGGPCVDSDECSNKPCSDICENTIGDYRCVCNTPGWEVDPIDKHRCKLEKTCRNLTEEEAPSNGGLLCHWYREENSQQCSVRCNPGYEYPTRLNNYEVCGPTTGFLWSHEEREELIEPCIEEFFPDFQLEANTTYFVRACKDLSESEKTQVKSEFAQMLTDHGVCKKGASKVCDMNNVGIICGKTSRRRKRGIIEEIDQVNFQFDIKALKIKEGLSDCDSICEFLHIPAHRCEALCMKTYKRFLKAAVNFSKQQLQQLFKTKEQVRFESVERHFEPVNDGLETSDVSAKCAPGMLYDGNLCVPCSAGTMHSQIANRCIECPPSMYQPHQNQTQCLPCPEGTTSSKRGSTHCVSCPDGRYGPRCGGTCPLCVNGACDKVTGSCVCKSGWTGEYCETDINSCSEESCYPGVECLDVAAPGLGFTCESCPALMMGDGSTCV